MAKRNQKSDTPAKLDPIALGKAHGEKIGASVETSATSAMELLRSGMLAIFAQGSAALVQYVETAKANMGKALGVQTIRVYVANFNRLALGTADATIATAALALLESGKAINAENMNEAKVPTVSNRGRKAAEKSDAKADPAAAVVASFEALPKDQRITALRGIFSKVVASIADPKARVAGVEIIEAYAKAA